MRTHFHPIAWFVITGTFLSRTTTFMTLPFLAIYLDHSKGISADLIGAILGISFLVGTFSSFFGGVWSDKLGRYPVMIGSMLLWGLTFIGFAFAESVLVFFLLSALHGFCRNVFEPTSKALLSEKTPVEQQLAVFNTRYFSINLGGAIGPLLGIAIGSSHSTLPFLITAAVNLVYGLSIVILKLHYPESRQASHPIRLNQAVRVVLTDRVFRYFLVGNMFVAAAFSHLDTTVAQYMGNSPDIHDGVQAFSYLIMANAISVVALQFPVLRLAKQFQALTCMKIGTLCFALGIVGFGLFHSILPLIVSVVFFTLGEILCFVVGEVMINQIAPDHLRGTYFGASGLMFVGQSIGPWLGGLLLAQLGFHQGAVLFGVLALLTMVALPFYQRGQLALEQSHSEEKVVVL